MSENTIDRYPLPTNWEWSTIGEICSKPQYGYTTKASDEGTLRLLRTTDITSGCINWDEVPFCLHNPEEPEKYLLHDGDIVISRAGSVGYSMLVERPEKAVFASYLIRFRPFVNRYFLKYFLQSPFYWREISDTKSGIALANVNAKKLQAIPIPIPPPNEQRRIVARIEELFSELDAGVAALEQARTQLRRYRQALLKAAFAGRLTAVWRQTHLSAEQAGADELEPAEVLLARIRAEREARWRQQLAEWEEAVQAWEAAGKPGKKPRKPRKPKELPSLTEEELAGLPELPEGWACEKIGNICEIIDGDRGKNYPKKEHYLESGYCVFLNTKNVRPHGFEFKTVQFISKEKHESLGKGTLQRNDIVFTSRGTIGNVALYNDDIPFDIVRINSGMFILRGNESSIERRYLIYYLQSPHIFYQIEKMRSGTAQPQLPIREFQEFALYIPSRPEQIEIIDKLEKALSTIEYLDQTIEQALVQAAALRQAILKKAFAGRLVPQNAEDEPASVLLERVRAEKYP